MPIAAEHQQTPLDFGTMTAGEITGAILKYLITQGYTVWSQNTTYIYDPDAQCWRVNPQGIRGVPDIIGFRNRDGLFIGVEVKAGRDQLRLHQKQFLDELKGAGGLAFVAHDLARFQRSFVLRGLVLLKEF
ncbi:VRR-NUC domain-containing protein [Hymenobacter artigasi]|uniref:VRR-NUC domain-containing protein n=1 Tax=Hymenobacter artigasi TaxID=2719616 RepID=A0ABX1HI12_9BACT|nr:VRR-NUC domain-containing protein [Hymenobacter artigasi]NKI89485.1 hypothetical protein [Hymenobacter artigasi]